MILATLSSVVSPSRQVSLSSLTFASIVFSTATSSPFTSLLAFLRVILAALFPAASPALAVPVFLFALFLVAIFLSFWSFSLFSYEHKPSVYQHVNIIFNNRLLLTTKVTNELILSLVSLVFVSAQVVFHRRLIWLPIVITDY